MKYTDPEIDQANALDKIASHLLNCKECKTEHDPSLPNTYCEKGQALVEHWQKEVSCFLHYIATGDICDMDGTFEIPIAVEAPPTYDAEGNLGYEADEGTEDIFVS
jgi:hypothetical protein